mgnify:FL=1
MCRNIIKAQKSKLVKVWGSGKQMRDFIHISDCVRGVVKTMDKINDASALNLSTGIYTSFIDFLNIGKKVSGYNYKIKTDITKPIGVYARAGSTKKQIELGVSHKIKLEEGIARGIQHFRKN